MTCIFRLDGNFLWPPVPATPETAKRREGTVEIHYDSRKTFLRWLPKGHAGGGEMGPVSDDHNIHKLDEDYLKEWFAKNVANDCSVWIHPRSGMGDRHKLDFSGAHLFTQFHGDQVFHLPLVGKCQYPGAKEALWSRVLVGGGKGTGTGLIQVDLHVPMPFPQTELEKGKPHPVFPFSAWYQSSVADPQDAARLFLLQGAIYKKKPFDYKDAEGSCLGEFGFAPIDKGSPAAGGFVHQEDSISDPVAGTVPQEIANVCDYWSPLSDTGLKKCEEILGSCGIVLAFGKIDGAQGYSALAKTLWNGAPSEASRTISLRFPQMQAAPTPDRVRFGYSYRLTLGTPATEAGASGDLVWRDGKYGIRVRSGFDGYVWTGVDRLALDCDVGWQITKKNGQLPSYIEPLTEATAALRVHWAETCAGGALANDPQWVTVTTTGPSKGQFAPGPDRTDGAIAVIGRGGIAAAASALAETAKATFRAEAELPHTFMPVLDVPDKQDVRPSLYYEPVQVSLEGGLLDWSKVKPSPRLAHLSLAGDNEVITSRGEKSPALSLVAGFAGFRLPGDGKQVIELAHDTPAWPSGARNSEAGHFGSWNVKCEKAEWRGKLSSLQFDLRAPKSDTGADQENGVSLQGTLRVGGLDPDTLRRLWPRVPKAYPFPLAVELDLTLLVGRIRAVAPEMAGDDEAGLPPLLIPTGERAGEGGKFALKIRESVSAFSDRQLEAKVLDLGSNTPDESFVVIGQEPFSVVRFSHKTLSARGNDGNDEVAIFDSRKREWRFLAAESHYRYTLPPQAVGESADKPRRLELHDLLNDPGKDYPGEASAPPVHRPYRKRNADDITALQRRAVEFRLTPSADIWVRPSDVPRNYHLPEWQNHALFRQHGEYGLGVAMLALRAEFLYGLPVGVDVARESGVARRARVAEIEALLGRPPGKLNGNASDKPAERWDALRAALDRRAERLEVWADDPDSPVAFAPARFAAGAQFALRRTALHRPPAKTLDFPEIEPPREPSLRYHPHGLSGGALWPVESANLFEALTKNPGCEGGSLQSVALSPLGGDAEQKATFLGGQVAILSRTRNGFIESQRVEVIGRVGALWHRAKHVVVYERTANPSEQFAPLFEDDPQRTRSRRTVLRKVAEFVEIIEHERAYPDFPVAAPRTAGMLERVRFNSRKINVDSAWSRDVGKDGWEIPLWNRAAARQRPRVYPMPDVAFCCIAEGEGENPVVAQECRDSDQLYFFADFSARGDDTDLWPVRLGVDYANLPGGSDLAAVVDPSPPSDDEGSTRRRPPVGRILPGMRRFTWRLAPAARKVAINARRSAKPLYVDLESISFMRATAAPDAEKAFAPLREAMKACNEAANGKTNQIDALPAWTTDFAETGDPRAELSKKVRALREATTLPEKRTAYMELKTWFTKNGSGQLKDKLRTELQAAHENAKNLLEPLRAASNGLKDIASPFPCERLRDQAIGTVRGKAMLAEAALRSWQWSGLIQSRTIAKQALIDDLAGQCVDACRPVFLEAGADVGTARRGLEATRAILGDLAAQTDRALVATRRRLAEFGASYDQGKPWSPDRRKRFHDELFALVGSAVDEFGSELAEARTRLALELDDLSRQIGSAAALALKDLGRVQAEGLNEISSFQTAIKTCLKVTAGKLAEGPFDDLARRLTTAESALEGIPANIAARLRPLLTTAQGSLNSARTARDQAQNLLSQLEPLTDEAAEDAARKFDELGRQLQNVIQRLKRHAKNLADLAKEASDTALNDLTKALNQAGANLSRALDGLAGEAADFLAWAGKPVDMIVGAVGKALDGVIDGTRKGLREALAEAERIGREVDQTLGSVQALLAPENLLTTTVKPRIFVPVLERLLAPFPEELTLPNESLQASLRDLPEQAAEAMRRLEAAAIEGIDALHGLCQAFSRTVLDFAKGLQGNVEQYVNAKVDEAYGFISGIDLPDNATAEQVQAAIDRVALLDKTARGIQNDLRSSAEDARAYGNRIVEEAGRVTSGGILAVPGNLLRLHSTVSSAPELAAMKADISRLRAAYDELQDVVRTTRANALFDMLGDELKAIGLKLPFDGIGDRLEPAGLGGMEIGKLFRRFAGVNLENLFPGCRLPEDVSNAIALRHDFDAGTGRAWVQIDIDAPMPGRRPLFSLEVFKADFIDPHLQGTVRFEADATTGQVTQSGHGHIRTELDMVVGGQSMVRFQNLGIQFSRESGLQVQFDPKGIRLNPVMQFVQDWLRELFPDKVGGMKVIKQEGIPVGLEHEFAMPPITVSFATSGISNLAISNNFRLVAFPDFLLANRFSLARPERPFIFSLFILGGTGYVHVDAEYRPFKGELVVTVEAGAGASAAIGFGFGPFSGQVFIALSVVLSYRRFLIGSGSGGGLSVGALLVVAGYVDVASIASAGIYVTLRVTCRDNGQMDANGSLSVTIRISRFFEVNAAAEVQYKLRDGRSTTTSSSNTQVNAGELQQKLQRLKKARS